MKELNDSDIFPYGKYNRENTCMEDVPAWFLLKQYDSFKTKNITKGSPLHRVMVYVEDNMDILQKELNDKSN